QRAVYVAVSVVGIVKHLLNTPVLHAPLRGSLTYYLHGYHAFAPQHFLYFFPEPQGQGSFRPTLAWPRTTCCGALLPLPPAMRACSSSFFLRRWNWASMSSTEVEARRRGGSSGNLS